MKDRDRTPIVRASYELRQHFRYEYPGPIRRLRHRLVVAPPPIYGDQLRTAHRLLASPAIDLHWSEDAFGNAVAMLETPYLDGGVTFDYEARLERCAGGDPAIDPRWLDDYRFRRPSRLTAPNAGMRIAAAALARSEGDDYALAARINAFVFARMTYRSGTTTVATTAAQAFAQRSGVCQDYAHIMIGICRLVGLPARYVSGHLLGEGGTHAWVEVLGRDREGRTVAWAFDPTHDRRATLDYVFIAAGRDYSDVTPTSGQFVAPYIGRFTTTRSVGVLDVEYAA